MEKTYVPVTYLGQNTLTIFAGMKYYHALLLLLFLQEFIVLLFRMKTTHIEETSDKCEETGSDTNKLLNIFQYFKETQIPI